MGNRVSLKAIVLFFSFWLCMSLSLGAHAAARVDHAKSIKSCLKEGWKPLSVKSDGRERAILWKRPQRKWPSGAIVVLHGGGGSHHQFCAGGKLLQPQIAFAEQAVEEGFAVFLLDSTNDVVTDENGRQCGKRFDFSVLDRRNIDLAFIGKVVKKIIPQLRTSRSSEKIFLTGLSTGGYMAIRAAVQFNHRITAFAPISAGDPFGTRTNCNPSLSKRKSAKGILLDLETNKPITAKNACKASSYPNEKDWPFTRSKSKPVFKQFHHRGDAIVDISCMKKAGEQLKQHGYKRKGTFILRGKKRRALNHLWFKHYNDAILEFFKSQ